MAYAYTMQSYEPAPGDGFPEDESKIDIYVNASETTSLDSIRERLSQDEANGVLTIHDEERVTLSNGLEALAIRATGFQGGDFTGIYTVIHEHEVSLTGIGDQPYVYVWQVANSLRVN